MAWQVPISKNVAGVAIDLGFTDSLYVHDGVTLTSTEIYGVTMAGTAARQVVIHGKVTGGLAGINGSNLGQSVYTVGETGEVTGLSGSGMSLSGSGMKVDNAGLIQTLSASAALNLTQQVGFTGSASVVNSGTIRGVETAIQQSAFNSTVEIVNKGIIEAGVKAYVDAFQSNDTILNTGTIRGDIHLGSYSDLLDSRAGLVDGDVLGGSGNDHLYTGVAAQDLFGGQGNDILMGGAGADKLDGGTEVDTASYASAIAGVKASLVSPAGNTGDAKGDVYISIERLAGSKFADTLVGNQWNNQITGGAGADTLTGGAGADRFVFNVKPAGTASADRITDFQTDLDDLRLDDAQFTGLALGDLAAGAFWASDAGTAHDGTDRVIYEKDTGWLRFDADGNGAGAAVAFAKLAAGLNLGADDFVVF